MTDTGNEISEILSADPTVKPEAELTTTQAADTGQGRDEQGRFAGKADEPAVDPNPVIAQPDQQPGQTNGMVPQQALHAERQKNADLERRVSELTGKVDLLSRPSPRAEPTPKVEIDAWGDPKGFAQAVVSEQLTPVQEQVRSLVFTYSKREAVREFGADKITAAETAMQTAIESGQIDKVRIAAQLNASLDPVGDVVRWHQTHSAIARVGSDPDAFVKAELAKMIADPAKKAELLQQLTGMQAENRSADPVTALPPSLSKLPGGTNTVAPSIGSDSERFAAALAG